MATFLLGTHKPHWLRLAGVPLFVSARRLREYKTPPRASAPWALDSGGFSELSLYGEWRTPATQYASEVRRWDGECGGLLWAAQQDWMCEPHMLRRTGLSLAEHQRRTVHNFLLLRQLAPDLPWAPVLQGWARDDYLRHLDLWAAAGVDLWSPSQPVVGLGSVCRRQDTEMAEGLIRELHGLGLRLHGFGFKLGGLRRAAPWMESADSMAWSLDARRSPPTPGHTHKSCANCMGYALSWRERAVRAAESTAAQAVLF